MPVEIPPGRPGKLIPEQEAKLKELWHALFSVVGILSSRNSTDSLGVTGDSTPDSAGKKKSRLGGLLGRKKNQEGDGSDAEDKHGQTKEFKRALAEMSPELLRRCLWDFTKSDDPDALLLRFLRARKWNVHDALVMLVSTIHWRGRVIHLDDRLMLSGEGGALEAAKTGTGEQKKDGEGFIQQLRMGKSFLHGTDREGRPLCFVRVRLHRQGEQSEASLENYTVYTIETARFLLRPPVDTAVSDANFFNGCSTAESSSLYGQSKIPSFKSIGLRGMLRFARESCCRIQTLWFFPEQSSALLNSSQCIVFDMTGFSMANMDYTPLKYMIKVFEANYPESLGNVLVHKSPWIFEGIWRIIRGWLDPVVASKVHFTKDVKELEAYIAAENIPTELGGQERWEYQYVEPRAGENEMLREQHVKEKVESDRMRLVDDYEKATVEWCRSVSGGQGQSRNRTELAQKLIENYWVLDPFIRARSLYDRTGVLNNGGRVDFYPKMVETSHNDVD